jgi:hypothetical protein
VDEKRLDKFRADVADLNVKAGTSRGPRIWRIFGAVLMLAGFVVAIIVYVSSLSQSDPRNIQSSIILALAFVAVTIIGAALYIAATIAGTLRLWLLRQLYEGQAHTDQIAAALRDRGV